jgi:hypothetical protein
MGKHCDLGHIVDPSTRPANEENPTLSLNRQQSSLAFDLIVFPNHKGHIVGPGFYELQITLAAENTRPVRSTFLINIPGTWYADPTTMMREGVGVRGPFS